MNIQIFNEQLKGIAVIVPFEEIEHELKTCPECGCLHDNDSDYCSCDCEDLFEYGKKQSDRSDDYDKMKDAQYENL